jgi:hypothetical protein
VDGTELETRLIRSVDGGATWTTALTKSPSGQVGEVATNPYDPGEVYVTAGSSVFRSTDSGASFSDLGLKASGYWSGLSFDGANPQTVSLYDGEKPGVRWAYTYPKRAEEPKSSSLPSAGGIPAESVLPTLSGLGAILSLAGLRLRRLWRADKAA